jgi:hypothetical protein
MVDMMKMGVWNMYDAHFGLSIIVVKHAKGMGPAPYSFREGLFRQSFNGNQK